MKFANNSSDGVNSDYLYDLLERIKTRPGMYLGQPSITRLNMLLTGYSLARIELGLPPTQQEEEFGGFQDWLAERYQIKSTQGWDRIILFYSADEREAFSNFFKLFEQWSQGEKAARSPEVETSHQLPMTSESVLTVDTPIPLG